MQGQGLRSAVVTVLHCNRTGARRSARHARRPEDHTLPPAFHDIVCCQSPLLLLRRRWWRPATTVPSVLSHLRLQCIELRLLIRRQQGADLVLRGFVDLHHLRPLIRSSYSSVFLQCLRLFPGVRVDGFHLRHLVWRQTQFLGQKLYLMPSHPTAAWTALSWRRRRSRILCHRWQ